VYVLAENDAGGGEKKECDPHTVTIRMVRAALSGRNQAQGIARAVNSQT